MARMGLTKADIRACRDRLLAEGRHPSADAVRKALGDTGSKSTIHRCLKELALEDAGAGTARAATARQLHALVEQIADLLHGDGQADLRARHEQALRCKDQELVELRSQVATLAARVAQLEARPAPVLPREQANERGSGSIGGFGGFGTAQENSRSGQYDASPFSVLRAGGRTEVVALDGAWPFPVRWS
ncbi:DNA-binding protein [Pseudoduganella chitinolytica]|uniref:DNA-binding protein n=1 Tax=Pseudoduganella chitinolytica TaxID=34070 RepID=A0ABY8BCL6_9BURK|nr:DNA-binding protein [Pseudoduganella chitinolytica]WEF33660.1 DNA-binding protein [Pseudoduganella chitinolytica]